MEVFLKFNVFHKAHYFLLCNILYFILKIIPQKQSHIIQEL